LSKCENPQFAEILERAKVLVISERSQEK
jgi:hypothetical protein